MQLSLALPAFDRERMIRLADGLAVACAVSLPWSTSATGILVVCWLIALIPTLEIAAVRRELATPAGGLPVLLWSLGVVGMLWSESSLAERLAGLDSFHKLLAIPLLLAQFRRSGNGKWVINGYFASCGVLLVASYGYAAFFEELRGIFDRIVETPGVPVKDYILQSGEFQLCAFGLAYVAVEAWRSGRRSLAVALVALALLFVGDIAYVVTSRTAVAAMPVLLVIFAVRLFGWKRSVALLAAGAALAGVIWISSPYLRARVEGIVTEIQLYNQDDTITSSGTRVEYWRKSVQFIRDAPIMGHGTGSIYDQFTRAAGPGSGTSSLSSRNPHQQVFTVGIQLGLIGIGVLLAMWVAHLFLFRGLGLAAWCGLVMTVQNVVGSQFNSHLFDFGHGWTYVFGVGVLGGAVLHELGATGADRIEKGGVRVA
jgi:O-antigen ligase